MSEEILYVLDRLIAGAGESGVSRDRLVAEATWWKTAHEHTLLDAVQRSFRTRQLCIRDAESDGTWRTSLSYIGDTDPLDATVCTYDYDRAELRFGADSPLSRPYAWADGAGVEVDTWYTRTGMSGITAWFIAVSRLATERRRRHLVLTNRLYHETEMLFELAGLRHVTVLRHGDTDELLAAMADADRPVVVYLDSSRPGGDSATLARVLRNADPTRVGCVAWDNTCAAADDGPFDTGMPVEELPVPVVMLRSHAKLDQLSMEFCSLGSIALVARPAATGLSPRWQAGLKRLMSDVLAVTGACASPAVLRLMASLGLPNAALAARGNQCLYDANMLGGRLLAAGLTPSGRYLVEQTAHRCFVEIYFLGVPAPGVLDALEAPMTAVERRAAQRAIPVWKSASFGFHYTALGWYAAEGPAPADGRPHAVLRVSFGAHEPAVTAEVAEVLVRQLTEWTA